MPTSQQSPRIIPSKYHTYSFLFRQTLEVSVLDQLLFWYEGRKKKKKDELGNYKG